MPYEEARDRAWFLTDKMAYELNLTPEQYDRVYEVNLDYFLSMRTADDCYGRYWRYRNADFRYILFDWQYSLYASLDYFFRPIRMVSHMWHYPVCDHYRYGYYYFERPRIYVSYKGGHWHRRSHNDRSPYYAMKFRRGNGMRDRYNNSAGHRPGTSGRPGGHRPENGYRPDNNRNDRPGRYDRDNTNNRPSATRPGSRPGRNDRGNTTRPVRGESDSRRGNANRSSNRRTDIERSNRSNRSSRSTRVSSSRSTRSNSNATPSRSRGNR